MECGKLWWSLTLRPGLFQRYHHGITELLPALPLFHSQECSQLLANCRAQVTGPKTESFWLTAPRQPLVTAHQRFHTELEHPVISGHHWK